MGAMNFTSIAAGRDAGEAYRAAVQDALYWHGHGGYTGTIAEKSGHVLFVLPPRVTSAVFEDVAWKALDERQRNAWRVEDGEKPLPSPDLDRLTRWLGAAAVSSLLSVLQDKWGPCVAVRLGATEARAHLPKSPTGKAKRGYAAFRFFGMASC